MQKVLVISILSLAFSIGIYGQSAPEEFNKLRFSKNSVFGSFGTAFVYSNVNGNYERQISYDPKKFFHIKSIRVGAGYWSSWGNEGYNFLASFNFMSGIDTYHLEMGYGLAYSSHYDDTFGFMPVANVGFRFQKPGGYLVFRVGIGVPEGLYASLGVNF